MAYSSRNEYLQSLNRMRANYQNQGNPLINREDDNGNVGNELSAFAYMETNPASSAPEQASKRSDFLGKLFGSVDEIAFQFGSGYVNGWEGGLDLGANILSGITKNEDFEKWAQQDLGAEAGRFIQTYANLTPWAIIDNAKKGNYADKDWWGNAISGFGDIMTAGFGGWDANQIVQGILSGGVSTLMALIGTGITELGNSIGGTQRKADAYVDRSFENDKNEKYGFDTSPISDTEAGQFWGGTIAHSLGEMLPSIQIGMAVGGGMAGGAKGGLNAMRGKAGISASAKAMKIVPKLASTGMMGLSSAGHATNEARKEGADNSKALAYGLASGAVEMGTEWIFPDGGVGGVNVSGKVKKSIAKTFVKEAMQEGLEEVASELFQPIIKQIYQDNEYKDAWDFLKKEYLNKDFAKQVALAGLGGAISGGIMSGVQNIGNRYQYGKNCSDYLEHSQNISELYEKAQKAEKKGDTKMAERYKTAIENEYIEMMDALQRAVADKSDAGKRNLVNMLKRLQMVSNNSVVSQQEQVQRGTQSLIDEYNDYKARKNAVEFNKWLANQQKDTIKYTVSEEDTARIMETKLENEDGSATRYTYVDEPNDFDSGWKVVPVTSTKEPSFYVYAKKPLKQSELSKKLPFDKISKKFNIPASLEKTYSKKLASKNPTSVIQFISRYAKTDAYGVLAKLGYDAFQYNDGTVIINDGKQFIKGDLKYGEEKGTYDNGSLVKRFGREGTNEELRGYLGENGRKLETAKERQNYARLIEANNAYTEKRIHKQDVLIADSKAYTDDMSKIVKSNNDLGVDTFFYVKKEGLSKASGFYENDGSIYLRLNTYDNRSLEQRNDHELYHYLSDQFYVRAITNLDDIYEEWAKKYPKEHGKFFEQYLIAYTGVYEDFAIEDMIKEEIIAEIYSRSITLQNQDLQQAMIDTINKVRDMGKTKALKLFGESVTNDNFKPIKVKYTVENGAENYDGKTTVESDTTLSEETKNGFEKAKNKGNDVLKLLKNKPLPIVESDNNPNQYVMVAPLYKADVKTPNEFYSLSKDVYPAFAKNIKNIAKLAGCKFDGNKARGIYTNNSDYRVREPSTLIDLGKVDASNADLAGSLMADLGYQQQESVIIYNYVSEQEFDQLDKYNQAIAFEVQIPKGKANKIVKAFYEQGIDATVLKDKIVFLKSCVFDFGTDDNYDVAKAENFKKELTSLCDRLIKEGTLNGKTEEIISIHQVNERYLVEGDRENIYLQNERTITANEGRKIISDLKAKSSTVLIEAGADVSKSVKYRLESVKSAFETALAQVVPDNGSYTLRFSDAKQSFAELNLARPKDRAIAIDNLIKRLKSTEVTLVDVFGEEKTTLGELLSPEQEKQARDIMLSTLNGKAEATKLARWAKALDLQKIKTHETARSFKLMRSIEKKITSGSTSYLSTLTDPVGELTLFQNVIKEVKLPFKNADVVKLANNVITYYTEDNFGRMLGDYGIPYNSDVYDRAVALKDTIVKGRALTAEQITEANNILQLIKNDLIELEKAGVSNKRSQARDGVVLAQAIARGGKQGVVHRITNLAKAYYLNVASPVNQFETYFGDEHPATVLLRDKANECGNQKIADIEKLKGFAYGNKSGETEIKTKAKNAKKVTFKGYKITVDQALKILNTEKTANDGLDPTDWTKLPFYKRGGSITVGAKRVDLDITPQDIADLKAQIPQVFLDFNDDNVTKVFKENGKYLSQHYRDMNHVGLEMVEGYYYPTSAVGDRAPDIANAMKGSINPKDWNISFMQQRVSRTNARYNLDGSVFNDIDYQIETLTNWANYAPWYREWTTILNSSPFGKGSSLYAIGSKSIYGFKELVDFINKTALGIPYTDNTTLLSKADNMIGGVFGNLNAVAMSGLFTQLKTWGSYFTGWQQFTPREILSGYVEFFKHGGEIVADKYARKAINQYSPTLKRRAESSEAFSANVGKRVRSKAGYYFTSVVRTSDSLIHDKAFYACLAKVKADVNNKGLSETELVQKAVKLLEIYSEKTQPTTAKFNVGMYRSGYKGQIIKQFAGMFQSMGQNIFQGLVDVSVKFVQGNRRVKGYRASIEENTRKANEYQTLENEALNRMSNATTDEEYIQAQKDYEDYKFHREGHEHSRATLEQALEHEKGKWTKRQWFNRSSTYLAGLVGSGLVLTLLALLRKIFTGKKDPKEVTVEDIAKDTAYQSFVNWLPIFGQIANAIKNDQDLSVFTLSNINDTLDTFKALANALKEGDLGHIAGTTFNSLMYLAKFFGVPASAIWELVNGAWYQIDKKSNLSFSEAMGFMTATKLRNNYSSAVKSGNKDRAVANLEVWAYTNSIKTSDNILEEIYRLNKAGETGVAPSAIPTKYTNEKGDETKLTSAQINAFKQEYARADKDVSNLLKIEDYKKQDDTTKASLMKRVYSAYRENALARVTGIAPTSKLGKLLYYTNGDVDMARYIMSLQNLSVIKEDKKHTRKENVISAINKMAGFSRQEKLLLAYLSGYNVSEKNQQSMIRFLVSRGFDKKTAAQFLKLEK